MVVYVEAHVPEKMENHHKTHNPKEDWKKERERREGAPKTEANRQPPPFHLPTSTSFFAVRPLRLAMGLTLYCINVLCAPANH